MKTRFSLTSGRPSTWYSNCSVSKWTPMSLAFTSNTPTASDGEISKITFLYLWGKSKISNEMYKHAGWLKHRLNYGCAELTGWAADRLWRSEPPSHGAGLPCISVTPVCSSWSCCLQVSWTTWEEQNKDESVSTQSCLCPSVAVYNNPMMPFFTLSWGCAASKACQLQIRANLVLPPPVFSNQLPHGCKEFRTYKRALYILGLKNEIIITMKWSNITL